MDIGKSFGFMFKDESWVSRVLIGGLLGLVPILNFVIYGYMLEVIKNVSEDRELPLPTWDDFGGKFMRGLMVVIAGLIYSIPLIVIWVVYFVAAMLIGGAASSGEQMSNAGGGLFLVCSIAFYCIAFIYSIVVYLFIMCPGLMRYADSGEFGVFFRFSENFKLATANLGQYVVMLLVILVASLVAGIVGTIACGIGVLFTSFWVLLVTGHLFGQYWKQNKQVVEAY